MELLNKNIVKEKVTGGEKDKIRVLQQEQRRYETSFADFCCDTGV